MYLKIEDKDISFKIDVENNLVIAKKVIDRKIYKIEKKLQTNSVNYLWRLLSNLENLPDEFWRPI